MTISSVSSVTSTHLTFLDKDRSSELYESIILDIAQELNLTEKLTFLHYTEKTEKNLICLKLDLSNQYPGLTAIKLKENDRQLAYQIKFIFQFVNQKFKELGFPCSCVISILNLSQNHISENSFLSKHEDISEEKENRYLMVSILNDIESINLNETEVSTKILDYLCVCKNLKNLKLDSCQKILDFAKPLLD